MITHIVTRARRICWRAAGSASAQEKFTFALNWFAVGDHAAYWVALDKGYYKAKGLDVTLRELQGLGRFDRQGRHRPRRCRPRRRRRGDRLGRPRHHDQDGRHGVRQDAAQHLQPQGQAAHQAQGPRGQDAGRASGRQPAPDVPGLRQAERHRRRARSPGSTSSPPPRSPPSPRSAWTASATTSTGLPFYEKAAGKGNVVMMPWADFGFDMYSMSIIASEKTMKERPEPC